MAINSKKKGNKFELSVSKWLTKWTGYKFERNRAGSGAWHSNRDATSDITCVDPKHQHRCRISVECKSYKDIKFEHVLLGNKGCDIEKFWSQAVKDAHRASKFPILCMRYNSMPREEFFFAVPFSIYDEFSDIHCKAHMILGLETGEKIVIFMASDVIREIDYKAIHKVVKKILKSS